MTSKTENGTAAGAAINGAPDIKAIPQDAEVRRSVRSAAARLAAAMNRYNPIKPDELEALGRRLLDEVSLGPECLGFAMVAVSNEFWRAQFSAIDYSRRLLLLPHCLRRIAECKGSYSPLGLSCARCGLCPICSLLAEAEEMGYKVLVAEGTPAVLQVILSGQADAILGVACLDSLEKAFRPVVQLGIPHLAVPLLSNGCRETSAELDEVRALIRLKAAAAAERTRSYVPLLRVTEQIFEPQRLDDLLLPHRHSPQHGDELEDPILGTEAIALAWLRTGGKRFRPFVTVASYAAMTTGGKALDPDTDLTDAFPKVVLRVALAIEALHKASLVHDDIEDDDAYRYGLVTLHRRYGLPTAINIGDYLIGLGYRLISASKDELGGDAAADILASLSQAHLKLSRGQGAELLWREKDPRHIKPVDLLTIYALKTAPAFEAAMYSGIRAAGPAPDSMQRMRRFCRLLGVAYQVLNDLKDWKEDRHDKLVAGQDTLSKRPTVLLTFALEAGTPAQNEQLLGLWDSGLPADRMLATLREAYETRGAFEKADALIEKYRGRAREAADESEPPAFRELLHFIVDVILQ